MIKGEIAMIIDYMCEDCAIASVCKAKGKLKAFTDDAKVDLGVALSMVDCRNYRTLETDEPQPQENTKEYTV